MTSLDPTSGDPQEKLRSDYDRMSDADLVEAVATKVMGWEIRREKNRPRQYGRPRTKYVGYYDAFMRDGRFYTKISSWNPLTDWNHTMEVYFAIEWKLSTKEKVGLWVVGHHQGDYQRAICLAALSAVSK